MTTSDLLFRLWPILMALLGGAFWIGVLEFRVRHNTKVTDTQQKLIERQREKQQKMEVDQAGWKTTLESINRRLGHIEQKLEEK